MTQWDDAWLAAYLARVPASRGAPPVHGGEPGFRPADSDASPAPQGVNAGHGRTGSPFRDGGEPRRNKFGAIRTEAPASWGGTRVADSKAGARLMRALETRRIAGSILDYFEEVSLPLGVDEAGKVIRYRADAMILLGYVDDPHGGEPALVVKFLDAKARGMDTRTSAAKRAALRKRGLNVEVVS